MNWCCRAGPLGPTCGSRTHPSGVDAGQAAVRAVPGPGRSASPGRCCAVSRAACGVGRSSRTGRSSRSSGRGGGRRATTLGATWSASRSGQRRAVRSRGGSPAGWTGARPCSGFTGLSGGRPRVRTRTVECFRPAEGVRRWRRRRHRQPRSRPPMMCCWQPSCAHHNRGRAGCRVPGSSGSCRRAPSASWCWSAGLPGSASRACWPTGRAATDRPVAWLSLDAGDNDPVRFWRHVTAALDGVRARRRRPGRPARARRGGHAVRRGRHRAGERVRRGCRRGRAGDRRLPPRRVARRAPVDGVPARPPAARAAPGAGQPQRPAAAARPAAGPRPARRAPRGRPALHPRARPPSCCAPRSGRTCPTPSSRRSASAPRAGPRACTWRRCRCRAAATSPGSSRSSPGATGSCSTTSPRRCSSASPPSCGRSCWRPRSSIGCAARSATRWSGAPTASSCWSRSSGPACS